MEILFIPSVVLRRSVYFDEVMGNRSLSKYRKKRRYWGKTKRKDGVCGVPHDSDKIPSPLPDLSIEKGNDIVETECILKGRRIVDFSDNFFLDQLRSLNNHSTIGCNFSNMILTGELQKGLNCILIWKCKMCNITLKIRTNNPKASGMDVNSAAVAGAMAIGIGHSQLEQLCATMEIPPMASHTYARYHEKVSDGWEKTAVEEMKKAVEEEKLIAIERHEVDINGTPILTVLADGSWAKRSYRTNYNSLSGMAAIVGFHTRKVLYMGIRNKFCTVCVKNENPPEHVCYRNWLGSSSSMEADIIVEGFKRSVEMYGVMYGVLVADGDSSVYAKIIAARPYNNLTVEKIECTNHLLRNFCKKIADASRNRRLGNIILRKKVADLIKKFRSGITQAVAFRTKENVGEAQKILNLKNDIRNGLFHNLGEHQNCASYFCKGSKDGELNLVPEVKQCALFEELDRAFEQLAAHSRSLIKKMNTNSVEQLNSVVAKMTGGKRINFAMRRSYAARCSAAVVSHNSTTPIYSLHKTMYSCSPGKKIKSLELKRQRRETIEGNLRKKRKVMTKLQFIDRDYGEDVMQQDVDEQEYEQRKRKLLTELADNANNRQEIQENTTLQRESSQWLEMRRKLLTASNFGVVCLRKPTTSCKNLVKSILYSTFDCEAFRYGRTCERHARGEFETMIDCQVTACGLFIDEELPFLGATPDGLVRDDAIVEIKCPSSGKCLTPIETISTRKWTLWNEAGVVNKRHKYFYQVQGQLHITKRKICYVVLWTPKGLQYQIIERDDDFWLEKMKSPLQIFYEECIMPEIIDPRHPRGLEIRDSHRILQCQEQLRDKCRKTNM